jgi:glycerol-3-phosphate dehydrogenase
VKRDLGSLTAREHDLVVVGGGIYGAAAAWDAAQRGLEVALVEARDFGAGVSWNSLKTIHGGLRYLQTADLLRLRQSVRERRALLAIAPRLVRPLPFLVPTYGHGAKGREALALALWLNALVSPDRNRDLPHEQRIPPSRLLSRSAVLDLVPGLRAQGLSGGAVWTDAQVTSSERLLFGFLYAAASAGAALANHVEALGFLRAGHRPQDRIVGVQARDVRTGDALEIRARMVLNAAGPAADRVLGLAGLSRPRAPLLRASNLVLRKPVVTSHAVGALSGGRYLFLVPWRDRAIVGTAYAPLTARADDARPSGGAGGEGARGFLEEVRRAYPWAELVPSDVTLVHQGLVPGTGRGLELSTRPRLHDHEAEDGLAGLITVQGVKYTTARLEAERAVDLVVRRRGRPAAPCRTAQTALPEARPLEGALEARTRHAVREEMAQSLADAVLRRLDLGTAGPPAPTDLEIVAETMAAELGWDAGRMTTERRALAKAYEPRLE